MQIELEPDEVALITTALQTEIRDCTELWREANNQYWLDRADKAENIQRKIVDQMGI
jgi:hypothetical protein